MSESDASPRAAALAALVAVLAIAAAGCGGDDEGGGEAWQIEGLGSSLDEIKENARAEGGRQPRPVAPVRHA